LHPEYWRAEQENENRQNGLSCGHDRSVIADKDKETITLENFATTPVLLQSVKQQRQSQ
jgi:hypothetical protein